MSIDDEKKIKLLAFFMLKKKNAFYLQRAKLNEKSCDKFIFRSLLLRYAFEECKLTAKKNHLMA